MPSSKKGSAFAGLLSVAPPQPLTDDDEDQPPAADASPVSAPAAAPKQPSQVAPARRAAATDTAPAAPKLAAAREDSPAAQPGERQAAAAAVLAAWESAQTAPRNWEPYSVRLPEALHHRLALQLAEDRERLPRSVKLAANHYLQAALSRMPFDDRDQCAEVGRRWRAAHLREAGATAGSPGNRLQKATADQTASMGQWFKTLRGDKVTIQDFVAGALADLLDEIEASPVIIAAPGD